MPLPLTLPSPTLGRGICGSCFLGDPEILRNETSRNMRTMLRALLGSVLIAAGMAATVCGGQLHSSDPDNIVSPPEGSPGFPSRDSNLDALPGFQNPPPGYGEVPFWWWTESWIGSQMTWER